MATKKSRWGYCEFVLVCQFFVSAVLAGVPFSRTMKGIYWIFKIANDHNIRMVFYKA